MSQGWFRIPNELIDAGLPAMLGMAAWTVLTAMLRHADETGRCWVGYRTLHFETGMSTSTIATAVKRLEKAGIKQPDPAPGRPNRYLLILPTASEFEALRNSKRASKSEVDALRIPKRKKNKIKRPNKGARKNGKPSKPKTTPFDPLAVELPFPSDAFRRAWSDWCTYRQEKGARSRLTPSTVTYQLRQCQRWGEPTSIQAIERSITNGWTGLFEPDAGRTDGSPNGDGFLPATRYQDPFAT